MSRRFQLRTSGDDETVLIHRKTALQLQQHYDNIQKHKEKATLVHPNDEMRESLEDVLRSTRRNRSETQMAATPAVYQGNNAIMGRPSFGNPTALNTPIAAAAFTHNNNPATNLIAPFALRNIQQNPSRIFLGNNFKRHKYCWRCGFQKKVHSDYGVPFGHHCRDNCLREDCSKCGQRVEFHHGGKNGMGPACMKQPSHNSGYHDWFKENETDI